jgi:glycosyltransferase involved in cell wall biosynthesis
MRFRHWLYTLTKGREGNWFAVPGDPPIWQPKHVLERTFFSFRDWLWHFRVEPAIKKHGLMDFDIYHLEGGLEFYRHGGFARRLADLGKPILNTYHGTDFRNRGVVPAVDKYIRLNLTSEYDLLPRHPNMKYLSLPFDIHAAEPQEQLHDPITICHATRSRYVKGSDMIIEACRSLEKTHGIRFLYLENRPHEEVLKAKAMSDIYVDQVADLAPGYGMNSVEAMAMGLACCTRMNEAYVAFMPDHPFVNVTPGDLLEQLTRLVENPDHINEHGRAGKLWAETKHSLKAVGDQLYDYYSELGIATDTPHG